MTYEKISGKIIRNVKIEEKEMAYPNYLQASTNVKTQRIQRRKIAVKWLWTTDLDIDEIKS